MRFIKNLGPRSHIGFLELNSLNMLNVDFRVKQRRLSHAHHHFTRGSTENLIVHSVNGDAATTFYYSGIKDSNSPTSDIKQKCTFNVFKSAARQ